VKYGALRAFVDQKVRVGGVAELHLRDEGGNIYVFYLLTKFVFNHKPTHQSLADSLLQWRDRLIDYNYSKAGIQFASAELVWDR